MLVDARLFTLGTRILPRKHYDLTEIMGAQRLDNNCNTFRYRHEIASRQLLGRLAKRLSLLVPTTLDTG
jgi:hypothetical protein